MPVRYSVSLNGLFVNAVAHGVLKLDDVRQYINDVSNDDCVKPGFSELFDVRGITASEITPEMFKDFRKLVLDDPKRVRGSKLAIVVRTNSSFYKAQKYERSVMPDVQNVIVFNDFYTAKIWLGVTDIESDPSVDSGSS